MRAIKRKKNEVKELARLKTIVGTSKQTASSVIQDVIMSDLVVATDVSKLSARQRCTTPSEGEASLMETDDTQSRKHSRRTLRDQHGQYPVWMNQRAIRKRKNGAAVTRRRAKVKRGSGKKLKKWLDLCSGQRHQRCDLNVNKGYTPSCHHLCTMSWCGAICSRPRIVAMAIPNICTPSICCDVVIFCNISY